MTQLDDRDVARAALIVLADCAARDTARTFSSTSAAVALAETCFASVRELHGEGQGARRGRLQARSARGGHARQAALILPKQGDAVTLAPGASTSQYVVHSRSLDSPPKGVIDSWWNLK